jgi:septal ring factor EnvC (AmiA/AmiB activator)
MEEKDASLERNVRDKKRLEKQVKALQNEILDMDISFEAAQDELKKLQQRLANREDKIQSLESARERSSSAVEQRLKKVEAELVLARLNATKAETLRLESVEIASSSVRAVESRERKLLEEVDSLKRQVERLEEEKRGIEYLHSVPANNDLLDQIKKLQKLLEEERGGIALDIRKEFERFDSTLKRERQQHEDELRPLRSRLEVTEGKVTSSTVGGRVQQLWRRIRRR